MAYSARGVAKPVDTKGRVASLETKRNVFNSKRFDHFVPLARDSVRDCEPGLPSCVSRYVGFHKPARALASVEESELFGRVIPFHSRWIFRRPKLRRNTP